MNTLPKILTKLTPEEAQTEPPGRYKRILTAVIANSATVGQVNQLLQRTNVRIVAANPNSPVVSLLIPPPGGQAELQSFIETLKASGVFQSVREEYQSEGI